VTVQGIRQQALQEGLGVFSMVCEVPRKPAGKLDGYAVDLIDGDRDPNTEHKISDTESWTQALLEVNAQEGFITGPAHTEGFLILAVPPLL
jgi:hypothetical protein